MKIQSTNEITRKIVCKISVHEVEYDFADISKIVIREKEKIFLKKKNKLNKAQFLHKGRKMVIESYLTVKGTSEENEDIIGYERNYFWIMDGVTNLFNTNIFDYGSDSRVLVEKVSCALKKNIDDSRSLEEIIYKAILSVSGDFSEVISKFPNIKKYELPTFTIALVRELAKNKFEYYVLGDSPIIVEGEKKITDSRLNKLTKEFFCKDEINNDIIKKEKLIQIRKKLNTEGGYWIGSVDGLGIKYGKFGSFDTNPNQRVIICSDGFSNLFQNNEELLDFKFSPDNIIKQIGDKYYSEILDFSDSVKKRDDLSIIVVK